MPFSYSRRIVRSACLPIVTASLSLVLSCAGRRESAGPPVGIGSSAPLPVAPTTKPKDVPLDFILDPVARISDWTPASEALRGKRAIVVVLTTWDGASLVQLRELESMFHALPSDTSCLLVALQSLDDRVIISTYFESVESPCIKAIGDASRGRLGDLGHINIVPTTLVLRADGTLVGAASGVVKAPAVLEQLDHAR